MHHAESQETGWAQLLAIALLSLLCACVPDSQPGSCVQVSNGRVTLECEAMPRLEILESLARAASFELVVGRVEPQSVSVQARDVSMTHALKLLMENLVFELRYTVDPGEGHHRLQTVVAGEREGFAGPPRAVLQRLVAARQREQQARFGELPPEEQARLLSERAARERAARSALEARLADSDPVVRRDAVAQLDAEGEDAERLVAFLAEDPDPRVRAEAAEQLAFSDSFAGVASLIRALGDPDATVVSASIAALTFAGDASVVPQLEPLLEHRDPSVRETAARAIESLK